MTNALLKMSKAFLFLAGLIGKYDEYITSRKIKGGYDGLDEKVNSSSLFHNDFNFL